MICGIYYIVDVKVFDYGNSYYLMLKEIFLDVWFVGIFFNSIGKFGGDIDNWVWLRYIGDFFVFCIYVGFDNKLVVYFENNVFY